MPTTVEPAAKRTALCSVHWAQWTGNSHLGLVVPGLRLLIRITAVGRSPVGAGRSVVSSSLAHSHPFSHPLRFLCRLVWLLGIVHAACQNASHQSSTRPHSYCVALRGRRCIRAHGRGGSGFRTDGQPVSGLSLFVSADPLQTPHPFSTPPPSKKTG